ncbi:phage tail tape measure protein [Salmonella enterica]|nr:phage tail tape measure protein [Salmonella enterica]EJN2054034.1 phage tail tape measure protein [Salmonella enterica]
MATLRELIIKISANSQSFQTEIARASRMGSDYYKTMQQGGRQAAAASRETQKAISHLTAQLSTAKSTAMSFAGAFSGMFATSQLIQYADTFNLMSARLKLASTSAADFAQAQSALSDISKRTSTSLEANTQLYSRIALSMRDAGYASADVAKVTETIASSLKLSGASAAEATSVIMQMSQALSSGVLSGEEFRAVMENGGRLARLLADGLGVSIGQLRAMAKAQELTTDKLIPLLTNVEALRAEMAQLPATVSMSAQKLENAFLTWVGGADEASGSTAALAGVIDSLADNIDNVATAAGVLVAIGAARYMGNLASGALSASAGLVKATQSEIALAQAQLRGTQISTAAARALVYQAQKQDAAARGTENMVTASQRLSAAQATLTRNIAARTAAQTALNNVTSLGSRAMGGALGLLGGVPGVLMLAASAWYTVYENQEQARKSAQAYISQLDQVRESISSMSLPEASDTGEKVKASLAEQNRLIDEQKTKIIEIQEAIAGHQSVLANPGYTTSNGFMINHLTNVKDVTESLTTATEQLAVEQERLSQMQSKASEIQDTLSGVETRRIDLLRQQAAEQNTVYQSLLMMNGENTEFNRLLGMGNKLLEQRQATVSNLARLPAATLTGKQNDLIKKAQQEADLSKYKGADRVRKQAEYDADAAGLTSSPEYIDSRNQYINSKLDAYNNSVANKPAKKEMKSAAEKLDNSYDKIIQKQKEQLALASDNTELAKMQYQISSGELGNLSDSKKEILLQNAALIDQEKIKKQLASYENGLIDSNAHAKSSNDADLMGAGAGDKARERMQEMLSIREEFEQKNLDIQRQYQSGEISENLYNSELALNKKYLAQRLEEQEEYYKASDELQNDFLSGASDGLINWADSAADYSAQASDFVTSAMSGMVDAIDDSLTGNISSWEDWALSISSMIRKILIQAMLVNSIKKMSGAGGLLGSIGSFLGGAVANAKGGVYSSQSLSAYSNQIIDRPTYFAFAKGAGLMGEAGPEAIMPLTRAADGSLGVRMVGDSGSMAAGGGGVQQNITQVFQINGNGDTALQEAVAMGAKQGAESALSSVQVDFMTNGKLRRSLGV